MSKMKKTRARSGKLSSCPRRFCARIARNKAKTIAVDKHLKQTCFALKCLAPQCAFCFL